MTSLTGQVSAVLEAATSAFALEWRVAHLLQPLLRQACSPSPGPGPEPEPEPEPEP